MLYIVYVIWYIIQYSSLPAICNPFEDLDSPNAKSMGT